MENWIEGDFIYKKLIEKNNILKFRFQENRELKTYQVFMNFFLILIVYKSIIIKLYIIKLIYI